MVAVAKRKIRLRRGDEVVVVAGEDKGRRGKVVSVDRVRGKVVVDGVNRVKVHQRPSQKAPQGGIVDKDMPIDVSNVRFWDPTEEKPSRIGYKQLDDGTRVRYSKASGETIEDA